MKTRMIVLLFAGMMAGTAYAKEATLPDACGSDKIEFDVALKKDQPAPAPPAAGKAQIIFVETATRSGRWVPFAASYTLRFGMDGKWVGAANNKSYFAVDVDPGEHHFCASAQGGGHAKQMIGMGALTAEPGKVYFYEFKIEDQVDGQGYNHYFTTFSRLDEDEGKFRVKGYDVSTWSIRP